MEVSVQLHNPASLISRKQSQCPLKRRMDGSTVSLEAWNRRKISYPCREAKHTFNLDIVGTVYHLVIYMQSNKMHNVVLMSKFIQHLC